jgi:hypothetical protein
VHDGAEVEPVLPGDDVVVLVLMQPDVDALGLVYIWRVRQVKVLRSPGTSPCASSTNLQIWLDEMLPELQAARNLADGVCVEAGFRVEKNLNYPRKLNQRTWTNCWSLRHVFRLGLELTQKHPQN